MGTNYYARYNKCACCERYEERHIGKSYRTLQATNVGDVLIASWADWVTFLTKEGVEVWNEYCEHIPTDEFITGWKPLPDAQDIVDYQNAEWIQRFGTELGDYVDKDGYMFSTREFS